MTAVGATGSAHWGSTGRPTALKLLVRNQLATLGLVLLSLTLLVALSVPVLPLPSPEETAPALRLLVPFSVDHPLGTDHLGRDMLSRLLWGTRVSIMVGASATLVAALFGSAIGIVAGYFRGRLDNWLMRGIDMLMAFPYILLALAIVAVLGPGLMNALYAIAVVNIPFFARNIRGVTLGLARREFVDAARLAGKGEFQILLGEVLPNVLPVIVITMSTTVGWMILETAGLSFLGLGAQPPQADLGSMLGEGRKLLINAPHASVIPGLMIFVLVMSINLLGDGIRDALDPRLKSGALARPAAKTAVERGEAWHHDPSETPGDALTVRDVRTDFRIGGEDHHAVGGVSFGLKEGECLGIIGESGSGKSVTALSLLALVPTPTGCIVGGEVAFDGRDLLSESVEGLRRVRGKIISYVFQDPLTTLHPLIPIGDQIGEALRAHDNLSYRRAWHRAVELLRVVRIPNAAERAHAYPHELSGGMRQRVGIAMALANHPRIMIADEPTTALDVTVQAQVLALLNRLRIEHGASLIFITHDFGVVSEMCDRVAVMYAGKIVEIGRTNEILTRPAHPYTRRLIDCVPKLGQPDRSLAAIRGLPPAVNKLPPGCAFAERCELADDACRRGEIKLEEVRGGRFVRCRKAGEV